MIAVDTNVLVYAHRKQLLQHETALAWVRYLAEGVLPWGIPVFCLGEFIRVVTHPRVMDPPSSLDQALNALEGLVESSSVRILCPGTGFFELFCTMLRDADARGNLAFDAQIAAVCLEQGASKLLTFDRDFKRFLGLEIMTPDEPPS